MGLASPSSINIEKLAEALVEAQRDAAFRIVLQQLGGDFKGGFPNFIRDPLSQTLKLINIGSSVNKQELKNLGLYIARGALASALIKTRFPKNDDIIKLINSDIDEGYNDNGQLARLYFIDLVYAKLGSLAIFKHLAPFQPQCLNNSIQSLCEKYASLNESELFNAFNLRPLFTAYNLIRTIKTKDASLDLFLLVEAFQNADIIGDFQSTPGLALKDLRAVIELLSKATLLQEEPSGDLENPDDAEFGALVTGNPDDAEFAPLNGVSAAIHSSPTSANLKSLGDVLENYLELQGSSLIDDLPLASTPTLLELVRRIHANLSDPQIEFILLEQGALESAKQYADFLSVREAYEQVYIWLTLIEDVRRGVGVEHIRDIVAGLKSLGVNIDKKTSVPVLELMFDLIKNGSLERTVSPEVVAGYLSTFDVRLFLQIAGVEEPCGSAKSAWCWGLKVVETLQNAIEISVSESGSEEIKLQLDAESFVSQLSSHGDRFLRQSSGQLFFHLTIGGGMLYSDPPGDSEARSVQLYQEQIGAGWAFPSKGNTTFKAGVYASGLLYRAVLDNEESEVFMIAPFIGLDIQELVQVNVSIPYLLYEEARSRPGFSFGFQLPLNAYLKKLSS